MSGSGWELMNRKLRSPPPLRAIQSDVGEQIETKPALCGLGFDRVERCPCRGGERCGQRIVLHMSDGARAGRRQLRIGIELSLGIEGPFDGREPLDDVRGPDERQQRRPEAAVAMLAASWSAEARWKAAHVPNQH